MRIPPFLCRGRSGQARTHKKVGRPSTFLFNQPYFKLMVIGQVTGQETPTSLLELRKRRKRKRYGFPLRQFLNRLDDPQRVSFSDASGAKGGSPPFTLLFFSSTESPLTQNTRWGLLFLPFSFMPVTLRHDTFHSSNWIRKGRLFTGDPVSVFLFVSPFVFLPIDSHTGLIRGFVSGVVPYTSDNRLKRNKVFRCTERDPGE